MDLTIAPLGFHPFSDEEGIDLLQRDGDRQVDCQVVVETVTIPAFQNRNDRQPFSVPAGGITVIVLPEFVQKVPQVLTGVLFRQANE